MGFIIGVAATLLVVFLQAKFHFIEWIIAKILYDWM